MRLANFVMPRSGGLRTALRELGKGYAAAGHEPVLVIPGPDHADELTEHGRVVELPAPLVPMMGGYRLLLNNRAVSQVLGELKPDRIEVSDRTTLRWTGRWAKREGVPSVMVSHESLDGLLPLPALSARLNRATARHYDRVICTTAWAAREFARIGAGNVTQVPLGVDLDLFHPSKHDSLLRASFAKPDELLMVCCTRLSAEKRPARALRTLETLLADGVAATLVMAGDGPLRGRLEAEAAGLPVTFTGFLSDRSAVASLLATADLTLAPGPIETFGLAALEALACGTPTVVSSSSALPAVIGQAGAAVAGEDLSGGVYELLARPEPQRRAAARARAETFGWDAAVSGFLAVHESLS
ncbi:GDP-mannose-dependent alpha-(1-6)-phosphatidylinositol dimannoside mannosyltransferase [Rhizocola hellebori]|uniref:GDP-mannose-dependent alpha-(1-6)-phosphatidylinositol dimannoside mannosyltransferase n=1 Tax=Rhizocola hellebori TaxID=1392758 RepID=A0A8J3QEK0_9ACTN|nr:GDP-mannose-dependent alpha-(1-6)-phosphatidylinositol dimannoside mannosyltransferase [Rhizocola hellebori]